MTSLQLEDEVALVTGGARGIGKAISRELAGRGATVVINYSKSSSNAEELAGELTAEGAKAAVACFDVADEAAVERGMKELVGRFSAVSILVNNAGVAMDSLLVRAKADDWDRILGVNLRGAFLCAREAAKSMMRARRGRIVNISSVIGQMGNPGQAAYSASKAGLFGLTKSLARELASRNITVNAVAPGYILTEMTAGLSEEQNRLIMEQIPLNRFGSAEDVAHTVAFLASPAAKYITGQIIAVNGGMYM